MSGVKKVEIAGAGLAGLALSIRLAQLGWQVSLHERSPDLRMFGSGIWLWENGLKSLALLGAYEAATLSREKSAGVASRRRRRCGSDHQVSARARPDAAAATCRPLPGADRPRRRALNVEVFTSSIVAAVRPEGVLVLENGAERAADLVVVADGAYSRLREKHPCHRLDGFSVARAAFACWWTGGKAIRKISSPNTGAALGGACSNPCTDGSNYVYLGGPVRDKRGRARPVDPALWRGLFPGAGNLFDHFGEVGRWDRIVNVRTSHWCEGHVAILGDAAHAMPPNLGQSANMAFTNAMALAMQVSGGGSVPEALLAWEKRQRPLTDHVQRWSYIYGLLMSYWPKSLERLRSDGVRLLARSDWFDEGLLRAARTTPAGYEGPAVTGS